MGKNIVGILIGILILNHTSIDTYSSNNYLALDKSEGLIAKVEPKRRDDKKKYIGEAKSEKSTKRYVGDDKKSDIENSKRRGTEKRYIGDKKNDEEDFFKSQTKKNNDFKDAKVDPGNSNNAKYNWGQEKKDLEFDSKEEAKDKKVEIIDEKKDKNNAQPETY